MGGERVERARLLQELSANALRPAVTRTVGGWRRLAACAQVIGPVISTYWWQGAIETAGEWVCLLKTPASEFESLAHHIRAEHSYATPAITATPISLGSPDYLAWIHRETVGGGRG